MKRIFYVTTLALSLLIFSTSRQSSAQSQQSAEGRFAFTTADGVARFVEFTAAGDGKGNATGGMTFNDTSKIPDDDNDDGEPPPRPREAPSEFYVKAEFDTMAVEKNRAVMSGVVRESSHKAYVGRYVQLVVEDNAENPRLTDRLSWGFCRPVPTGWVPSDHDQPGDRGAYLSWWATDAERKDDVGIPSRPAADAETKGGCRLLTLAAYEFDYINAFKWEGDIVVRQ